MADSLTTLAITLAKIIFPITISVGVVGNALNIVILTRPVLRHHSCSRYFLALGFNNLLYCAFLMYSLLVSAYQIYPQNSSLFWCKFLTYISNILALISPYFIVLASFDRFCASSTNAQLRNWSNPIVARWAILLMIIFWALFHINTLALCDLRFDDYLGCSIRTKLVYNQIYVILQVILFNVVAPCLMGFFGMLTIFNTKKMRFLPTVKASYRRTEGQLIRMLLVQVAAYVVLNMPFCVMYLMILLPTGYQISSSFIFGFLIADFGFIFSYALPIFLFILSARIYREVFLQLVYRILRINGGIRVNPMSITNGVRLTTIYNNTMTLVKK
ncbi:unnamed protein product [Rotaria sp. Silwood2]|nr:unnamed protein product [Rotaria sp. Silwood2]CAF3252862.1 unnamed protein product [Rotaria sp. Silwood2]CAF4154271.1 unnamed protein product [Rotaria sp. Silwood2]CAF4378972.1 unnamed protein product [Rotaria sp. Silwood2]